jgi:hypothetical protein
MQAAGFTYHSVGRPTVGPESSTRAAAVAGQGRTRD